MVQAKGWVPIFPLMISLALLFSGFSVSTKYNFPLVVMVGMLLGLFFRRKVPERSLHAE
jgi:hypothetical protein